MRTACLLALLAAACGPVAATSVIDDAEVALLRAHAADGVAQDVKLAHEQNAEACAPKELAVAEANLRFARLELDQGDAFRAEEHMGLAAPAAKDAVQRSKDCGKVTVLIREKEPEAAA